MACLNKTKRCELKYNTWFHRRSLNEANLSEFRNKYTQNRGLFVIPHQTQDELTQTYTDRQIKMDRLKTLQLGRFCADPFKRHKQSINRDLRNIPGALAAQFHLNPRKRTYKLDY